MPRHAYQFRATRVLAVLALAAYAGVGLFGHGLHALLPCSDGSCGSHVAAVEAEHCGCCCHHDHGLATSQHADDSGSPTVQAGGGGHDAANCSLCVLLAKIKVGEQQRYQANLIVSIAYDEPTPVRSLLSEDLVLSGAPRGPPRV